MKSLFLAISAVLIVIGLIALQLGAMQKYHPNAELLLRFLRRIGAEKIHNNQNQN